MGISACIASSLTVYFFNLIRIRRTDHLYYVALVGLMVTVEMCVGISVSCMPLIARLYKAKKETLKSNLSVVGRGFKNVVYSTKAQKISEKEDGYSENGTYTHIEATKKNGAPAHLDVHITGATMSFATQTSSV